MKTSLKEQIYVLLLSLTTEFWLCEVQKVRKNISKKLKINNQTTAMKLTSGFSEVFCYAFECEGENKDRILFYINAKTGLEEQIYVVIESDDGILVM